MNKGMKWLLAAALSVSMLAGNCLAAGTVYAEAGTEESVTAEVLEPEGETAETSGAAEETAVSAAAGTESPEASGAESSAESESTTEVDLGIAGVGIPLETLAEEETPVIRVIKSDAILYGEPDEESEQYGTVARGETVDILEVDGNWSRIRKNNVWYYVRRSYLREASAFRGLIAIDPGHQAHANTEKEPIGPGSSEKKYKVTGGATGNITGVQEYELVLEIALKMRDELLRRGYDVLMIRTENDVDLSNIERATMANEAGADAFLRLHADSSDSSSANGIMTICQTSDNPYNAELYSVCRELAYDVLNGMLAETGAKDRGVYESDTYSGINWAQVPVTIVEMGFLSNPDEEKLLQSDEYQLALIQGMCDGIDLFLSAHRPAGAAEEPQESMTAETAEEGELSGTAAEAGESGEADGSEETGATEGTAETVGASELGEGTETAGSDGAEETTATTAESAESGEAAENN